MQRVVDLELWTKPRGTATPLDGKAVARDCCIATGLSSEVVLGLSFLPDPVDVQNLAAALAQGEVSHAEFVSFCAAHSLVPDSSDGVSATWFIAFVEGQALAWLHFPSDSSGLTMALSALEWADAAGFVISRGQGEAPLSKSELEAFWKS